MGILAGHAPLVTALRPGILTIFRGGAREPIVIGGGSPRSDPAASPCSPTTPWRSRASTAMTLAADIKDAEEDMADATDQEQRDKLVAPSRSAQSAAGGACQTQRMRCARATFRPHCRDHPFRRPRSRRGSLDLARLSAQPNLELGDHPLVDLALERHHQVRQLVQSPPSAIRRIPAYGRRPDARCRSRFRRR